MKAFFSSVLAFIMMLFSLVSKPGITQGIVEVRISLSAWGCAYSEHKIDLARGNLWEYKTWVTERKRRNPNALFEGYRFAGRLEEDKIQAFLAAAEQYGFADWAERYMPAPGDPLIMDGTTWSVKIVFADGTTRESIGYMTYPDTWDEMAAALAALTGKAVL